MSGHRVDQTRRAGHVVVVGGGLAGLSAALRSADAGLRVTLLEARPRLGGATWSFERRGLTFDNGQHVHLACCSEYRAFLERLGTAHLAPFAGPLRIPVLRPGPGSPDRVDVAWIKRDPLPAPYHLARSLLTYRHLPMRDRLRLLPASLLLAKIPLDETGLDAETFGDWLRRHGQSERAIERLFDLITLPTTNLRAHEVSLALAAKVFQTGLLTDARAGDIAWSQVPLAELHVEPARRLLESLGATVRTSAPVSEIVLDDGASPLVRAVRVGDEVVDADAVVVAVPHRAAAGLLPAGALPAGSLAAWPDPADLADLGTVPIVNVHVVFDRRVMSYKVAAAVDSPVQFVFDRSAAAGLEPSSSHQVVAISLSGAYSEIGKRPDVLIAEQLAGMRRLFPSAGSAQVLDAVVTREHEATFRGIPGTRLLRLGARSAFANLALAGAWTDTGWPATMEGAVRSGNTASALAVRAVADLEGRNEAARPREEVSA